MTNNNQFDDEVAIATARYDTAWLRWTYDDTEENYINYKDAEQKLNEASRRELAAKALDSPSRAQSRIWAQISQDKSAWDNSNEVIVVLTITGASVRLEVTPDRLNAVVSFCKVGGTSPSPAQSRGAWVQNQMPLAQGTRSRRSQLPIYGGASSWVLPRSMGGLNGLA